MREERTTLFRKHISYSDADVVVKVWRQWVQFLGYVFSHAGATVGFLVGAHQLGWF